MMSKLGIARQIAAVGAHVAREHVTKPMAVRPTDVPRGPQALTAEWLTAVLWKQVPGAHVVAFTLGEAHSGTTARGRIELTYDSAGQAAGLPACVWFKATPTLTTRLVTGVTGAAQNEGRFYIQIRPGLELLSPLGYHAAADPTSGRTFVLIEDIGTHRHA